MTGAELVGRKTQPAVADAIVSAERSGGRAVVTLSGELDADVEAEVSRTINRTVSLLGLVELCLDTTRVTFIDSSGLRQLVLSRQSAIDRGVELSIAVETDGPVARLLELTGLNQALPIEFTRREVSLSGTDSI